MSTYRKHLEEWLSKLDVKAETVLDIGGAQLPVYTRTRSWQVDNYKVFDLPDPHEKKYLPDIKWDINLPIPTEPLPQETYDVVFCLEVMEYIWNPVVALANMAWLTTPGGTLYISFPHYYPPHEPYEQDYLRYTLQGAKKLLEVVGFEVAQIDWRLSSEDQMASLISREGLRLSKRAHPNEHRALGFIIKATKL